MIPSSTNTLILLSAFFPLLNIAMERSPSGFISPMTDSQRAQVPRSASIAYPPAKKDRPEGGSLRGSIIKRMGLPFFGRTSRSEELPKRLPRLSPLQFQRQYQ